MRRVPGTILNGGGGVVVGAASGQNQFKSKLLRWANPVTWKADRYTKVVLDCGYASMANFVVRIQGAQDGDRLVCSFTETGYGIAETVEFLGVDIGAVSVQARIEEDILNCGDPGLVLYFNAFGASWKNCFLFFMRTRGQLYLTRTLWKCNNAGV